jgi:hypothetical protein
VLPNGESITTVDEASDERRRYTTRLQRKAQAYVTQELGDGDVNRIDVDRQVAMRC